tara:strand:+ start:812 stop:952 length:141 start_codon:yes stop_codon:yes gene_type:complete
MIGAMAVVRSALRKGAPEGFWLARMLAAKVFQPSPSLKRNLLTINR